MTAPPPASRRRSSREALLAAALAEFGERGYEAATVHGIAERAGVTTGALYAHFHGKLDLLLQALGVVPAAALLRELTEVAARSGAGIAQLLGDSMAAEPDEAASLLLDAIVAGRRDAAVGEILRAGLVEYEQVMARATEAAAALGLVAPALVPEDLARTLSLLALGRLVLAAVGRPGPSPAAYRRVADLLLSSAAPAPAPPADPLERVRAGAEALGTSREELAAAVAAAVAAGASLRRVAVAADLSHERVRQIVRDRAGRGLQPDS